MVNEAIKVQDQRVFERFHARLPAKFKDTRDDFGQKIVLRDASAEGARIMTSEKLFVHDNITFEVAIPDGKDPLTLKGEVVWAKNREPNLWDVGMRFHKISLMRMSRLFTAVTE